MQCSRSAGDPVSSMGGARLKRQLRTFLGLEPTASAGRWFSVVLLIGISAVLYTVATDWDSLRSWRRLGALGKAVGLVIFGAVIIVANELERRKKAKSWENPMSAQHLTHDDGTLAESWRSFAEHASTRVQIICLGVGAIGIGSLALFDAFRIPALLSVVAGCFGGFSLARQRMLLGGTRPARWLRVLAAAATTVAALSALAAGLLVLRAIFGGSVEVMRR
jgi:hypothetical protein